MVKILEQVSREFASLRNLSADFQSKLLSVQDMLAGTTNRCFQSQKADMRNRSWVEGAFQAAAFAYSIYSPDSKYHEMVAGAGRIFANSIFDPRRLDHENLMRKTDSSAQQAYRQVTAIDDLKRSIESMEQQLQQQRQSATSV